MQTLRGHDSEIVSLQWALIEAPPLAVPPLPKPKGEANQSVSEDFLKVPTTSKVASPSKTGSSAPKSPTANRATKRIDARREPPKPIVDAGDMFDIHSFDYLEDEFGAISSNSRRAAKARDGPSNNDDDDDAGDEHNKSTVINENFNFIEECQTLREQIRGGSDGDVAGTSGGCDNQSDSDDSCQRSSGAGPKKNRIAVNISDIQDMIKNRGAIADGSLVLSDDNDSGNMESCEMDDLSNRSTIGSSHNTVEIAELEDVIQNLNINDAPLTSTDPNDIVCLASGAQESSIVIWNTEDGSIVDKIQLKSQGRVKIPSTSNAFSLPFLRWFRSIGISNCCFLFVFFEQSQTVRLHGFVQMN